MDFWKRFHETVRGMTKRSLTSWSINDRLGKSHDLRSTHIRYARGYSLLFCIDTFGRFRAVRYNDATWNSNREFWLYVDIHIRYISEYCFICCLRRAVTPNARETRVRTDESSKSSLGKILSRSRQL